MCGSCCAQSTLESLRYLCVFAVPPQASLPYAMAGLRVALTIALILAVFIEMITSGSGLGYLIAHYREAIRVPDMYGAIIAVAILGYCLNMGFVWIERISVRWHHLSLQAS